MSEGADRTAESFLHPMHWPWCWVDMQGHCGHCSDRPLLLQSSHAITLQKTVEYITKLQQERGQMQEEARRLREEIEELNATIL